jgi:uncharacterized protein YciW
VDIGLVAAYPVTRRGMKGNNMTQTQRERLQAIIHAVDLKMVDPCDISRSAIAVKLVHLLADGLPEDDKSLVFQVLGVAGAA